MKMTPAVVLVSFLLLLLTWLLLSGLNLNSTRFDQQTEALDRFFPTRARLESRSIDGSRRAVTQLRCAGAPDRRVR
jgi:hypothetical protein